MWDRESNSERDEIDWVLLGIIIIFGGDNVDDIISIHI